TIAAVQVQGARSPRRHRSPCRRRRNLRHAVLRVHRVVALAWHLSEQAARLAEESSGGDRLDLGRGVREGSRADPDRPVTDAVAGRGARYAGIAQTIRGRPGALSWPFGSQEPSDNLREQTEARSPRNLRSNRTARIARAWLTRASASW